MCYHLLPVAASGTTALIPAGHYSFSYVRPLFLRAASPSPQLLLTSPYPVFVHWNKSTTSHPPSVPLELVGLLKEPYSDVLFRVITNIYTFRVKVGYGFPSVPSFSTCLFKSAISVELPVVVL